jgi:hypothetical protein
LPDRRRSSAPNIYSKSSGESAPVNGSDQHNTIYFVASQFKDPIVCRPGGTLAADADAISMACKRRELWIEANLHVGPFKIGIGALPDYLLVRPQRQSIEILPMLRDGDVGRRSGLVSDDFDNDIDRFGIAAFGKRSLLIITVHLFSPDAVQSLSEVTQ